MNRACLIAVMLLLVSANAGIWTIRAEQAETTRLLRIVADVARDPLTCEWEAATGRMKVIVTAEPGESDAKFQARFDDRVAERQAKHPPVEDR